MAGDPYTLRGLAAAALTGACIVGVGCAFQAAFAPTVRVSCPARTSAAPDCDLRWLVAFDRLPVRRTPLPALQPVGEIVPTSNSRRATSATLYLNTASGPVRTIMWGDQLSLQHDLQEPLRAYLGLDRSPAIELTMWPSRWVDPGGAGDNRLVRRSHPVRLAAHAVVVLGLLFWVWLPVQAAVVMVRKR